MHEHVADLTLMSDVRALAEDVRERYEHIDVLANNAGALFASRRVTSEGFERTFALNHLAPFLLTNLLRDRLAGGRVVTTASDAHTSGRLDLDDLQSEKGYAAMRVYGTSKLCNILFTRELAKRAPELHANCFHPGVVRTGFGKNENGIWKVADDARRTVLPLARARRALARVAGAVRAGRGLTGEYVQDEKVMAPSAQAQDDTLAEGLWERSAELVGPVRRRARLSRARLSASRAGASRRPARLHLQMERDGGDDDLRQRCAALAAAVARCRCAACRCHRCGTTISGTITVSVRSGLCRCSDSM